MTVEDIRHAWTDHGHQWSHLGVDPQCRAFQPHCAIAFLLSEVARLAAAERERDEARAQRDERHVEAVAMRDGLEAAIRERDEAISERDQEIQDSLAHRVRRANAEAELAALRAVIRDAYEATGGTADDPVGSLVPRIKELRADVTRREREAFRAGALWGDPWSDMHPLKQPDEKLAAELNRRYPLEGA